MTFSRLLTTDCGDKSLSALAISEFICKVMYHFPKYAISMQSKYIMEMFMVQVHTTKMIAYSIIQIKYVYWQVRSISPIQGINQLSFISNEHDWQF